MPSSTSAAIGLRMPPATYAWRICSKPTARECGYPNAATSRNTIGGNTDNKQLKPPIPNKQPPTTAGLTCGNAATTADDSSVTSMSGVPAPDEVLIGLMAPAAAADDAAVGAAAGAGAAAASSTSSTASGVPAARSNSACRRAASAAKAASSPQSSSPPLSPAPAPAPGPAPAPAPAPEAAPAGGVRDASTSAFMPVEPSAPVTAVTAPPNASSHRWYTFQPPRTAKLARRKPIRDSSMRLHGVGVRQATTHTTQQTRGGPSNALHDGLQQVAFRVHEQRFSFRRRKGFVFAPKQRRPHG